MLVDEVELTVQAGNGGNGAATFLRDGRTAKGGPDGGDGGKGGSVWAQGTTNVNDLSEFRYKKKVSAGNGANGMHHNGFGKNGEDLTILLPLGTELVDTQTGQTFLVQHDGKAFLLAKGGKGGRGNVAFKSPTNRAPKEAEPGEPGQLRTLHLTLRFIADIGLIGLPNAGKSSLLAALTNASPRIAPYPFTTLNPMLGMMGKSAIADIPGLIEGASDGKGLGIRFLKHIEKTQLLVHCIDSASVEPMRAYEVVRGEFGKFNPSLLGKRELIVLTKTDLVDENVLLSLQKQFTALGKPVTAVSVMDPESVTRLRTMLGEELEPSHV